MTAQIIQFPNPPSLEREIARMVIETDWQNAKAEMALDNEVKWRAEFLKRRNP